MPDGPRVLHVISGVDASAGGPVTALVGLARAQRRAGIDARVFATWRYPTGPANAPLFAAAGVPLQLFGKVYGKLSWHPGIGPALRRAVTEADVVHIHGLWEQVQHVAAVVAREARRPYLYTAHGMLTRTAMDHGRTAKRLFLALRMRRNLDAAAAIHFTTDAERRDAEPLGLRSPALVESLGLDLAELDHPPAPSFLRTRYPELAGRPILVFLGRISHEKGLDLLVPAFARAFAHDPAPALVIVGPDAGVEGQVRRLVEEHGLAGRVKFAGMITGADRLSALADADLFVLVSRTENFGLAVLEAMAMGRAVIISDQVRIAEYIAGDGVGEVVPLDIDRIARALADWTADPARRRLAGDRAREVVRERFDWSRVAERWAGHYERMVAGRREART